MLEWTPDSLKYTEEILKRIEEALEQRTPKITEHRGDNQITGSDVIRAAILSGLPWWAIPDEKEKEK
jgi:hypothetical protein